jgi:hypothetical protein
VAVLAQEDKQFGATDAGEDGLLGGRRVHGGLPNRGTHGAAPSRSTRVRATSIGQPGAIAPLSDYLTGALGADFARALHANLYSVFYDFGEEKITKGSHLEKLCLVSRGIGRDNISDFTTNLIKEFLLGNYVLLTPRDILTREDIWISRQHLVSNFESIALAIPNEQLRAEVNNYFRSLFSQDTKDREAKKKETDEAVERALRKFPEIIEYYIREREEHGEEATVASCAEVTELRRLFIEQVREFVRDQLERTTFYQYSNNTYKEARERVIFLRDIIENKDGYRIFYLDGKPIKREMDLQILFRLTWRASLSDVNREVNNGRGPVDFKISRGCEDKALVEFKLASNSQLKRNLEKQVGIYQKASDTRYSIKVILYFSEQEHQKVVAILRELDLQDSPDVILIDGRNDNKPSASKA